MKKQNVLRSLVKAAALLSLVVPGAAYAVEVTVDATSGASGSAFVFGIEGDPGASRYFFLEASCDGKTVTSNTKGGGICKGEPVRVSMSGRSLYSLSVQFTSELKKSKKITVKGGVGVFEDDGVTFRTLESDSVKIEIEPDPANLSDEKLFRFDNVKSSAKVYAGEQFHLLYSYYGSTVTTADETTMFAVYLADKRGTKIEKIGDAWEWKNGAMLAVPAGLDTGEKYTFVVERPGERYTSNPFKVRVRGSDAKAPSYSVKDGFVVVGKSGDTLEAYLDLEDPFSARWYSKTYLLLKKDYVDKGKIKIAFKNFPLEVLHPNAIARAVVARCAAEQRKGYFEMVEWFFSSSPWNYTRADFVARAKKLGLDVPKFEACYDDSDAWTAIRDEVDTGTEKGFYGVPVFVIGSEIVQGSAAYEIFEEAIRRN